jgi:hypothetical protein
MISVEGVLANQGLIRFNFILVISLLEGCASAFFNMKKGLFYFV